MSLVAGTQFCPSFRSLSLQIRCLPRKHQHYRLSPGRSFHSARIQHNDRSSPVSHGYYELFPRTLAAGPPPNGPFAIDLNQLRKEFYQLQAKVHPDRFADDQKARAEGLSANINEAYRSLQDPLKRAQYLLSVRGIDVAEDESAKVEDPELLMEVLEMRERIEAVEEEGKLHSLKETNDQRIADSISLLDQAFKMDDLESAKDEAVKLRYWTNIKETLDSWEKGKPAILNH